LAIVPCGVYMTRHSVGKIVRTPSH
jgi:hypothetical protein